MRSTLPRVGASNGSDGEYDGISAVCAPNAPTAFEAPGPRSQTAGILATIKSIASHAAIAPDRVVAKLTLWVPNASSTRRIGSLLPEQPDRLLAVHSANRPAGQPASKPE